MPETMNAAVIRREWVGSIVDGRFPLLQWLGGSAGAGVFVTEMSEPAAKAIIKLIVADTEDAEIRAGAWDAEKALSHPNLVRIYAHGRDEIDSVDVVYVVEEFAEEVLADILHDRPLTPREAREMLGPTLDALAYLHAKGFVHSRLKPSNIVAIGDHLKLTADDLLFAGAIGKPSPRQSVYDAPETTRGSIGSAADIWSLGATIVEVLTQYPPLWDRGRPAEPNVPESTPEPFAAIARKCLRNDPAQRCSIDEIKSRLKLGPQRATQTESPSKSSPSRRRVWLLLAAAAVILAVIGIWRTMSKPSSPVPAPHQAQDAPAAAQAPPLTQAPAAAPAPVAAPQADATPTQAQPPETETASVPPAAPAAAPAAVPATEAPARTAKVPAPGGATVKGEVSEQAQPDVAPKALNTITGTVKLSVRLAVDVGGNVADASLDTAGPSQYFANKALDAARKWKFKPAEENGQAVASNWILHFQFKRSGIDVTPDETAP